MYVGHDHNQVSAKENLSYQEKVFLLYNSHLFDLDTDEMPICYFERELLSEVSHVWLDEICDPSFSTILRGHACKDSTVIAVGLAWSTHYFAGSVSRVRQTCLFYLPFCSEISIDMSKEGNWLFQRIKVLDYFLVIIYNDDRPMDGRMYRYQNPPLGEDVDLLRPSAHTLVTI
jgi:hypothetical protein